MEYTQAEMYAHYDTCMECNCSAGRAQLLAHMQQVQRDKDNRAAVEAEFTATPLVAPQPGPSDSGSAIPEYRRIEIAIASCACTICNAARTAAAMLRASGYREDDSFSRPRELAQSEPPILEPERDCLGV